MDRDRECRLTIAFGSHNIYFRNIEKSMEKTTSLLDVKDNILYPHLIPKIKMSIRFKEDGYDC